MDDVTRFCRKAALAQVILDSIKRDNFSDAEAVELLLDLAGTLHDGHSDWATELIYEAIELSKDGRER